MDDDTPRDDGDPTPAEVVDSEPEDSEDISPSVEDDTLDDEPTDDKTVPYSRFKDVNDRLRDIEAKYAAATAPKDTPSDKKEAPPKRQYSEEQIETIRDLAGTKDIQAKIEEQEKRWEAKEREEQKAADDRDRRNAVNNKDLNPYGFKDEQVQKQVVKWGNSSDPDKQWLAAASYERIVKEMTDIHKAREAKKGDTPPKVESTTSSTGPRNPDIKDDPNVSNPLKYKRSLGNEAVEFMRSLEGGGGE